MYYVCIPCHVSEGLKFDYRTPKSRVGERGLPASAGTHLFEVNILNMSVKDLRYLIRKEARDPNVDLHVYQVREKLDAPVLKEDCTNLEIAADPEPSLLLEMYRSVFRDALPVV